MSKIKKSKRINESEESSSSSSSDSSSSSESNASRSSKDKKLKKSKTKKQKKIKSKQKKKQASSSSSSEESGSESDSSSSPAKQKSEMNSKKVSKISQSHKEKLSNDKYHYDRKGEKTVDDSNKHARTTDCFERSRWDSPKRDAEDNNERNRRRGYDNYNRNQNYRRYNDGNRGWRDYRRNFNHDRQNWSNNRNRYDRNEPSERNRDRESPARRDRHGENESQSQTRRLEERRTYNGENNERQREERHNREEKRSRSRSPRRSRCRSPRRSRNFSNRSGDDRTYEWGKKEDNEKDNEDEPPVDKEKPDFGLSGKLTEDANKVNGVVIKYAEPPEARKPKRRWRLYPFKGEKALQTLYIHRQSCYLVGRDRKVCDLPVDHPSCSKQHAALQYRLVPFEREDGSTGKRVRLYLIDLDSANGTFLNNKPIEPRKYVELLEKDVIKFGFSSREYVLLHENSKEEDQDDDVLADDVQIKEEPND